MAGVPVTENVPVKVEFVVSLIPHRVAFGMTTVPDPLSEPVGVKTFVTNVTVPPLPMLRVGFWLSA
jgi:hypothetical protein